MFKNRLFFFKISLKNVSKLFKIILKHKCSSLKLNLQQTCKCEISRCEKHVRVEDFNGPKETAPDSAQENSNEEGKDVMRHPLKLQELVSIKLLSCLENNHGSFRLCQL